LLDYDVDTYQNTYNVCRSIVDKTENKMDESWKKQYFMGFSTQRHCARKTITKDFLREMIGTKKRFH
jgi:hypothetical protein